MNGQLATTIPPTEDANGNKLNSEERFIGKKAKRTAEGTASLLGMRKDTPMTRSPEGKKEGKPTTTTTTTHRGEDEEGNKATTKTTGTDGEEKHTDKEEGENDEEFPLDWKPPYKKRIKLGNDQTLELPYKYDFLKYDLNLPGLRELALPEIMRNNAGHIDYRTISHQRVLALFQLVHNSELAEIPSGDALAKKREEDKAFALANNVKRRKRVIPPEEPDGRRRASGGGGGGKAGARLEKDPADELRKVIPRNLLKMTASGVVRGGDGENNDAADERFLTKFTPVTVQEAAARSNAPLVQVGAYWIDKFAKIEQEEIRRLSKEEREIQRSQTTLRRNGIRDELHRRREEQTFEFSLLATSFRPTEEKRKETNREQLWRRIAVIEVPGTKSIAMLRTDVELRRARLLAHMCAVEVRKRNALRRRMMKTSPTINLKRLSFVVSSFWRAAEKHAEDYMRNRKIREKQEKIRLEQEQEAKMQEQRLQFLLNQSELYAHFVTKKTTEDEEELIREKSEQAIAKAVAENPNSVLSEEERKKIAEEAKQSALEELRKTKSKMNEFDQSTKDAREKNKVEEEADFKAMDVDKIEQPKMLNATLKHYQLEGLRWIANLYNNGINGILADEMGLGKTVQSIALLAHLAENKNLWGPFLVAAPTSTLPNWCNELKKFIPDFNVIPYWGSQDERKTLRQAIGGNEQSTRDAACHVFVTSYDLLLKDEKYLNRIKWQYMVLDEAQAIKNSSSLRWKALLGFKCRNRLLLTGTPVQNTMQELWALLHFIMPTLFDSHEQFAEWFSKGVEGSVTNGKELNEHQLARLHAVLKPFMLRRLKTDVLGEMVAKEEHVIKCGMSRRQKEMYRSIKKSVAFEQINAGDYNPLGTIIQLRKVCSHPDLFEERSNSEPFAFSRLGGAPGCYIGSKSAISEDGTTATGADGSEAKTTEKNGIGGVRLNINALLKTAEPLVDVRAWRSEIEVPLPKLAFRDFGILFSSKEKLFRNDFNVVTKTSMRLLRMHNTCFEWAQALFERDEDALTAKFVTANGGGEHRSSFYETEGLKALHFDEHSCSKSKTNRRMLNVCGVGSAKEFINKRIQQQLLLLLHGAAKCYVLEDIIKDTIPFIRLVNRAYQPRVLSKPPNEYCSDYSHYSMKANQDRMSDYVRWALWESTSPMELTRRHQKWKSSLNSSYSNVFPSSVQESEYERKNLAVNSSINNVMLNKVQALTHRTDRVSLLDETMHIHGNSLSELPNPGYDLALAMADSGKLAALDKLLYEKKASGSRVLIFAQMTTMLDLLETYLRARQHKFVRLDGSTKVSDRAAVVSGFQSDDSIFVFMLSTRAGGLGINLTAADTVIFFESDWNPTVDQQAMDRAHRLGQTKTVHVYRLICRNTVEEYIAKTAKEKEQVTDLVLKGNKKKEEIERVRSFEEINDAQTTEISKAEALKMLMEDEDNEDENTKERRKRMEVKIQKAVEIIRGKKKEGEKAAATS
jgi:SNF2 family DNA or RNA helicase